jgi:hypothetical protein
MDVNKIRIRIRIVDTFIFLRIITRDQNYLLYLQQEINNDHVYFSLNHTSVFSAGRELRTCD